MPNLSSLNLGDGVTRSLKDPNAVSFAEAQTLTEAQKTQARNNIGAGSASYSVASESDIVIGTDTTSKVIRCDYLNSAVNSLIDTKIDTAITQVLSTSY